jgi:hypothetical protein
MNLVLQLLAAGALIAVMMILRIVTTRQVVRQRMACRSGDEDCAETECFGGCGGHGATTDRNKAERMQAR